ncbi:MAG: DUF3443 family protein [Candidatus Sulfotelmatobacter sp.]
MRKAGLLVVVAAMLILGGCFKPGQAITQPPISISIIPGNTVLTVGEATTITANVYDQSGQGVTWSALPVNFGALSNPTFNPQTLTASVTYTAPTSVANPTTVTVTATSITNPNIASSVSLHFSPISVSLLSSAFFPIAPQTVNPGDPVNISSFVSNDFSNLGVTWSLSPPTGAGSLSNSTITTTTYTAPGSVSGPSTVTVTAASVKDPAVTASAQITVLPSGGGPNVVTLNVDGGPVPGQIYPNAAFTSLTICYPGSTTTCQTVDGILVDTASYGLRVLQSKIPLLKLPTSTDPLGNTLENCASWPDGSFLWGPVSKADVYIGQETASGSPALIQVISSALSIVPDGCSNGGTASDNTPQLLGANGILGIGPEPTDCTLSGVNYCDGSHQSTPPNVYYACPSTGCSATDSPVLVNAQLQVSNPIPLFAADSNGVVIQIPSVSSPQASVIGTMTFGIGTESNNGLGSATVLTLDDNDNFATVFNGQTLSNSFIDSGSNALLFPDSLPACTVHTNLYCPSNTTNLTATVEGKTQGQATVNFSVDNADTLFSTYGGDAVFGTLAGPSATSSPCQGNVACVFDWGFPFLYGRTVYIAIDGQSVPAGSPNAPWWAF